jgi:hypothetical protein
MAAYDCEEVRGEAGGGVREEVSIRSESESSKF